MQKRLILIVTIILAATIFACKPTPETEPVENKIVSSLQERVSAMKADPYVYIAPINWQDKLELTNVLVTVDAEIIIPAIKEHPVYQVVKHSFSTVELNNFLVGLGGDIVDVREADSTRDELLEDIYYVTRGLYVGTDPQSGEPVYESYDGQAEELAALQKQLNGIDEQDPWRRFSATDLSLPVSKVFRNSDQTSLYTSCNGGNLSIISIRKGIIQPESWVLEGDAYPGERPHMLNNLKIEETTALEFANDYLTKIGQPEFKLSSIQKARVLLRTQETASEGWYLIYVRDDGLESPVDLNTYSGGRIIVLSGDDYTPTWPPEYIAMYIDEEGVRAFYWRNAYEIQNVANPNVQLLPFSRIQDSYMKYLKYGLSWVADYDQVSGVEHILLTKLVLTNCIQRIQNENESAYLAPAWVAFITTEQDIKDSISPTILVISAVDGSYVNTYD